MVAEDLVVLIGLDRGEQQAEQDGQHKTPFGRLAVADLERVVSPGDRRAGQQQGQGVHQRQVEGLHHFHAFGRPGRPGLGDAVEVADIRGQGAVAMEQGHFKEDPEPGHEEHHFGGDEQDHAVAKADGDNGRMIAGVGFLDHILPPAEHGVEHAGQAQIEDDRVMLLQAEQALHPDHAAHRHDKGGQGTDQRPGTGVDQVVIVFDGVARHLGCLKPRGEERPSRPLRISYWL